MIMNGRDHNLEKAAGASSDCIASVLGKIEQEPETDTELSPPRKTLSAGEACAIASCILPARVEIAGLLNIAEH